MIVVVACVESTQLAGKACARHAPLGDILKTGTILSLGTTSCMTVRTVAKECTQANAMVPITVQTAPLVGGVTMQMARM
jgi:hypothetical protein